MAKTANARTSGHIRQDDGSIKYYVNGTEVEEQTASGGAVTQATNRSTGVTLNTRKGVITMNGASLAAGAEATFTVTNSEVAAVDVVVCNVGTSATGTPAAVVSAVAAGSFDITVTNLHASTADTTADTINFVVLKGANS